MYAHSISHIKHMIFNIIEPLHIIFHYDVKTCYVFTKQLGLRYALQTVSIFYKKHFL